MMGKRWDRAKMRRWAARYLDEHCYADCRRPLPAGMSIGEFALAIGTDDGTLGRAVRALRREREAARRAEKNQLTDPQIVSMEPIGI